MARKPGKIDYATEFGRALDEQLADRSIRQADLARATESSPAYINRMMTGSTRASPQWVDLVAKVLKANPQERRRLHRAAAKDAGFKIDLDD
jgi:plasmid maintenance system antidote protein VapI